MLWGPNSLSSMRKLIVYIVLDWNLFHYYGYYSVKHGENKSRYTTCILAFLSQTPYCFTGSKSMSAAVRAAATHHAVLSVSVWETGTGSMIALLYCDPQHTAVTSGTQESKSVCVSILFFHLHCLSVTLFVIFVFNYLCIFQNIFFHLVYQGYRAGINGLVGV